MGMMDRVVFRGKRLNRRTVDMVEMLEFNLLRRLDITQGSYNGGGVSASAGTHDGGGAVDFWTYGMSEAEKRKVCEEARKIGFAWWLRRKIPGLWNEHFHGIALDDPEASRGARNQMIAFRNRRNGLANNGPDDGPWVGVYVWPRVPMKNVNAWRVRRQFLTDKPVSDINVKRVQWVLNERLGINLLVDGVAGRQTRDAWLAWEKKIGIKKPNRIPDLRTINRLSVNRFKVGLIAWKKYYKPPVAKTNKK